MARIPDSELERLKKEIPIERLVLGFGVDLQRHGAELIGTCPFHDDKDALAGDLAAGQSVALPGGRSNWS